MNITRKIHGSLYVRGDWLDSLSWKHSI